MTNSAKRGNWLVVFTLIIITSRGRYCSVQLYDLYLTVCYCACEESVGT